MGENSTINAENVLSLGVEKLNISDILKGSYLNYAMSVIMSRALPDVRDGLKPVHRRIIFASHKGKFRGSGTKFFKSARIVGDTMGSYHPHGDVSIYETMVRLAQPWWMMHPLVSSQGNWGSRDGDKAAAHRYTEARLAGITELMLADIDKDCVDWQDNYSGEFKEPKVLPARFPNLLVNGQAGIAVAMATKIPTHNLGEVLDACNIVLDNPNATLDDILMVMPGPDFPTKGTIMGLGGIRQAYETGNGSIKVSGKFEIEQHKNGKSSIIITELPYGVSPKSIIERVASLVNTKDGTGKSEFEGVSGVRDESDRNQEVRVVVDIKKDFDPHIALNFMKKKTDIVSNFSANMVCIDSQGVPTPMGLMQILKEFVAFRIKTVRNRTIYDLNKARDQLFKQIGLYAAVSIVDEVVRLIRASSDAAEAKVKLMELDMPINDEFRSLLEEAEPDEEYGDSFRLSEGQADSILELRLSKLTSIGLQDIADEVREISSEIKGFISILNNRDVLNEIIRTEWAEIKAKHAKPRMTIIDEIDYESLDEGDLVERKDIIISISKSGYVKRTEIDAYREQKRGGKGRSGMETKDDDFVKNTLVCTTKTPLVVFTTNGKAHQIMAYKLPDGSPAAKGRPLVNFVPLEKDETVAAIIAMPENEVDLEGKSLVFVTDFGTIRRNSAKDFWNIKSNGKISIDLKGDNGAPRGHLVSVILTDESKDILIATEQGQSCRSPVADLRVFNSRKSVGVKGITLAPGNKVISASDLNHVDFNANERDAYHAGGRTVIKDGDNETNFVLSAERMKEMKDSEETLLTISSLGFCKRSSAHDYRVTSRGGKGIMAANINVQTGSLVACFPVKDDDGLILTTDGGQTIRTRVSEMRQSSRMTKGVKAFKLPAGQKIVGVALSSDDVDDELDTSAE